MLFIPRRAACAWTAASMAVLLQAAPKPPSQAPLDIQSVGLGTRMIAVCEDATLGRLDIWAVVATRLEAKAPLLRKLATVSKGPKVQEAFYVLTTASYWEPKEPEANEPYDFEPWGILRQTKDKAELSRDTGRTWVQASQSKDGVTFPLENQLIQLFPRPETFTPERVQSLAFSDAKVAKFPNSSDNLSGSQGTYPVSTDGILALACNSREAMGIFKLPLRDWIIPIKGVRVHDRWILSSLKPYPLLGSYVFRPSRAAIEAGDRPGIHGTAPVMLRMELREDGLDLGFTRQKWVLPTHRLLEALEVAMVVPKANLRPLAALSDRYQTRWNQPLWVNNSEPESFSKEADAAYLACNLPLHVPPPFVAAPMRSGDRDRNAKAIVEPLLHAAQAGGTRVAPLLLPNTP